MDMSYKNFRRITVSDMEPHVHSFLPTENKIEKILNWIRSWILLSLECGKISPYDLLPSKVDIACHIGVSQGTMQSVFRLLEDEGLVESKQRIGTYIKDKKNNKEIDKLTSVRDFAIEFIKKYILENNYKIGDVFIPIRKLAKNSEFSNTTLRFAMASLVSEGVFKKQNNSFIVEKLDLNIQEISPMTLAEKIANSLKEYIKQNFSSGMQLPSSSILANKFKVSTKTIYDAEKILSKEGIIYSRRGQYGTVVSNDSDLSHISGYFYEKYEQKIRQYIAENCNIGDKLPSIRDFAQNYKTSEKTIRKALGNLMEEGYITFMRGRYGGTFVLDIPQSSKEAYKWLAINSDYNIN